MATDQVSMETQQRESKYEFEREDKRFVARTDKDDEEAFAKRLGFKLNETDPEVKPVVRSYVIAVHRRILYYVRERRKEEDRYKCYMILTVLLVVAIPIVTALLPLLPILLPSLTPMREVPSSTVISTQIIAVIAGVFGVHRLYSTWMFRRNSAYAFWQASAQLKTLLYSLEQRWARQVLLADKKTLNPLFLQALKDGRTAAEDVVTKEQDSFFQALGNIKVDLQDIVTKAVEASGVVTSKLTEPVLKEIVSREQKTAQIQSEVAKTREDLVTLLGKKKLIGELVKRLENRTAKEKDAGRRSDLQSQIKTAKARLASIDFDLADRKAAYQAKLATAYDKKSQTP